VRGYEKQGTRHRPLEAHIIAKVFHTDDGMFIGNSRGSRDVRRTAHVHRLKGKHHYTVSQKKTGPLLFLL